MLTADRLEKVVDLQSKIGELVEGLEELATEEQGEWQPGSPAPPPRMQELREAAKTIDKYHSELERLYS